MVNILAYIHVSGKFRYQEISDLDWQMLHLQTTYWEFPSEDEKAVRTLKFIEDSDEGQKAIERNGPIARLYAFQHNGFHLSEISDHLRTPDILMHLTVIFNPIEALKLEDFILEQIGPELREQILKRRKNHQEEPQSESGES